MTHTFDIFDDADVRRSPLSEQFEERLGPGQVIERCGFFAYHIAEHHAAP